MLEPRLQIKTSASRTRFAKQKLVIFKVNLERFVGFMRASFSQDLEKLKEQYLL